MSKALQYIDQLENDRRWKFQSHGVCIAMKKGVPTGCFIFESWGDKEVQEFADHLRKLGSSLDLKLIGNPGFIMALRRWTNAHPSYNLIKTIVREVPFEMLYTATEKQFKISLPSTPVPAVTPTATPKAGEVIQLNTGKKIKVLIVDDSQTIRRVLTSIFEEDPMIEVIGALEKPSLVEPFLEKNKPDVITLDIHMPEMDGVALLKKISPKFSIPTIMISSITKEDGPYVFDALANGAFDYIQKPSFKEISSLGPHILERVRQAAQSRVGKRAEKSDLVQINEAWTNDCFLLLGASTGGTEALATLLRQFPDQIPPILVVQHIPPVFSKAFAERLDGMFRFKVVEAADGELIEPNKVFIAPGGRHMGVSKRGGRFYIAISDDPPVNRHRPSVDFMFHSAVKAGIRPVVGCILTGMGGDGAKGLLELRRQGHHTIGQDEASCVVYGMPKCAFELGAVEVVAPIEKMGPVFSKLIQQIRKEK